MFLFFWVEGNIVGKNHYNAGKSAGGNKRTGFALSLDKHTIPYGNNSSHTGTGKCDPSQAVDEKFCRFYRACLRPTTFRPAISGTGISGVYYFLLRLQQYLLAQ